VCDDYLINEPASLTPHQAIDCKPARNVSPHLHKWNIRLFAPFRPSHTCIRFAPAGDVREFVDKNHQDHRQAENINGSDARRNYTAVAATDGSRTSTLLGLPLCAGDTVSVSDTAQPYVDDIEQRSI
jgi:hypothetical protein